MAGSRTDISGHERSVVLRMDTSRAGTRHHGYLFRAGWRSSGAVRAAKARPGRLV